MKVFIICTIRDATQEYLSKLTEYVQNLEKRLKHESKNINILPKTEL